MMAGALIVSPISDNASASITSGRPDRQRDRDGAARIRRVAEARTDDHRADRVRPRVRRR
jgi:hypothetical protein